MNDEQPKPELGPSWMTPLGCSSVVFSFLIFVMTLVVLNAVLNKRTENAFLLAVLNPLPWIAAIFGIYFLKERGWDFFAISVWGIIIFAILVLAVLGVASRM